jgi:dTDP-4-amino-4,6-dideoxygalactose transaminase
MKYLDELYTKQKDNAKQWQDYIKDKQDIQTLKIREEIKPSFWAFTILSQKRDLLLEKFRQQGFYSSKMHLRNDVYSVFGCFEDDFKGVNKFSKEQLNLPCGWWVKNKGILKDD